MQDPSFVAGRTVLRRLGHRLGEAALAGDVIALVGDLGAGKTFLAQHIAHGAGVSPHARVTSPTFTLVQEHPGRIPVHHADLYRLSDPDELRDIGLFERGASGLVVVEWADRMPSVIPVNALWITLTQESISTRRVTARVAHPDAQRLWTRATENPPLPRVRRRTG